MADEPCQLVNPQSLEAELDRARAAAAGSVAGVFGPSSVTWRIDREAAIFLGAGRALLLQLAHPWIAAAIEQHSDALSHPIARFHRTFRVVFSLIFGSLEQSLTMARRLHQRHAEIEGQLPLAAGPFPAGSLYYANAIPALRWVYATLIETALIAYELMLPPLTSSQREAYYQESQLFAALFGIPSECLPRNWTAFADYVATMMQSDTLTVTNYARVTGCKLIAGGGTWLPVPASYELLTAGLLPPKLREAFGLNFGAAEERAVWQSIARLRSLYRRLPARLRYVGPYQEAQGRLAGEARPDLLTRMSNRFWIGQYQLPGEA